jgi:hypothetical protein
MNLPQYPTDRVYIYQTDKEFSVIPAMHPSGCYFMSWVESITAYFNLPFTHESVIEFYNKEVANTTADVDNEMFVSDPQNLIDDLIGKDKVKFLGVKDATYECGDDEIEIGCWHKDGANFNHFTHNNGKGIVLYDPWSSTGSSSVIDGQLISKRVAKLI